MLSEIIISAFDEIELFKILNVNERQLILECAEFRIHKRGDACKSQPGNHSLYFLCSGKVRLEIHDPLGEIKIGVLGSGNFFNIGLFDESRSRIDYAFAIDEEATYMKFDIEIIRTLMKSNGLFCYNMLEKVVDRATYFENKLFFFGLNKTVPGRFIELLVSLAKKFGRKIGTETLVKHNLSQQEMADIISSTRQSVTLTLQELQRRDLIHYTRNKVLIRDIEKIRLYKREIEG